MGPRSWLRALRTAGQGLAAGIDEAELADGPVADDPLVLFDRWFRQARDAGIYLHESMTLATATPDGAPSAREVLLKGYGPDGFAFYTNYESRKAAELEMNPRAALLFHWATLHRQVRIEGPTTRTTAAESEAYHASRPRGSRIAAWASQQSAPIDSRADLERRFHEREAEFRGRDVPLPAFWGGYRVRPDRIEFWQGRANRMHDRLLFRRDPDTDTWQITRLSP
jgi:pyridoxamine 5'-phosphate oxidase